jgi:AcrR family transcriptional regulator
MKDDRRTRYTKMALRDSLMELLEDKPVTKITVKELCEKADLNRTTFYAHYASPAELLAAIEDETLEWAREKIAALIATPDRKEALSDLEEIFAFLLENSTALRVLLSERGDIGFQRKLFELIYEACALTPPPALKQQDRTVQRSYLVFVVSGSIGLIQQWLKDDPKISARKMAEIIYSVAALSP